MDPQNAKPWPWWVRLSLLGLPGRAGAWACVWASAVMGAGSVAYAWWMHNPYVYLGAMMFIAAFLYWLCIWWVDKNSRWEKTRGVDR